MAARDDYVFILEKFQAFDKNRDGLISYDELKRVLQHLDSSFSDEKVKLLLDGFDLNIDSKIQYEEFVNGVLGGPDTSRVDKELVRQFSLLTSSDVDLSHHEHSAEADRAYEDICEILDRLGKEDMLRVRSVLMADFRRRKFIARFEHDEGEDESALEGCEEDDAVISDLVKMDASLAESWADGSLKPKFPASKVPKGNLDRQIRRGEIEKAAVRFEVGEEALVLSGKNETHWIFTMAFVETIFGMFNGKIWYGNSWSSGYAKDRIHAQERMKKIGDGLKFQPGEEVEIRAGSLWLKCKLGTQIRLPLDIEVDEPKLYEVILPKRLQIEDSKTGQLITRRCVEGSRLRKLESG